MIDLPDARGRYGDCGGRYVPETLMTAHEELERAYVEARADPSFQAELAALLRDFAGRPTPPYPAAHLTRGRRREPGARPGGGGPARRRRRHGRGGAAVGARRPVAPSARGRRPPCRVPR